MRKLFLNNNKINQIKCIDKLFFLEELILSKNYIKNLDGL
jgi:hypothetical protein